MFKLKHVLSFLLLLVVASLPIYGELSETEIKVLKSSIATIPVIIVVDEFTFCIQHMPYKWHVKEMITQVNREFKEVGIQFDVTKRITMNIKPVMSKSQKIERIEAGLRYIIQNVAPPNEGIVILFTSRQYTKKESPFYQGKARGRHCLVTDNAQFIDGYRNLSFMQKKQGLRLFAKMLAHEICHLLHILHVDDNPDALMHPEVKLNKAKFCNATVEKIIQIKSFVFKKLKFEERYYQQPEQK